ncbi:DUF397 domain-containing protein [Streptomyces lasalocidi]
MLRGASPATATEAPSNCIEVAHDFPAVIPVRDSKAPHGPALVFPADSWASFVAAVKGGRLKG